MAAPGVVVSTATRSGPTGVVTAPSGQYFVIGLAERGPVTSPVKITSMGDYKRVFGERVTYGALYDDLAMFFECGGKQAHVLRVTGASATVGTLSVNDTGAIPTIRFDAASPGAWSTGLTVEVEDGTTAGTRKVTVRLGGEIVEQYNNLATVADIVSRFAGSTYVKVADLGSVTAAPGNLPVVTAATALSAGSDDRAAVNATRVGAQLDLFKVGLGDGAVAAPGYGASMHSALIEHARTNRRIALLSGAKGSTAGDLAAVGIALATTPGAEYAGLFGPWVLVSDGAGGARVISPEGFVAASRAKAHEQFGPWAPGAGEGSISPYILGTDVEYSKADAEVLDAARVSPIRVVANRIRLYGWRSLSANETDFSSLTVADSLNRLVNECETRLEPFVFRPIDGKGKLLAQMQGILIGVLEPIRIAGGIFERVVDGEVVDPGYSVDVSPNVNTTASLQNNEVRANVAVRLSPNASLITLQIVKVGLAAAV